MNVINSLNDKLLNQVFMDDLDKPLSLSHFQYTAFMYAQVENSIAVLSDMKDNKSYLYKGAFATEIGILKDNGKAEINSIWEEEIFRKIHPDDLLDKHLLELQFFNMIKNIPIPERSSYHVYSRIRMMDKSGKYIFVKHRMFYMGSQTNGSLWLALCLYNFLDEQSGVQKPDRFIVNSATGQTIRPDNQKTNGILSTREKEILVLIRKGKISKEIAGSLSISIFTVNRHRQNILEKLMVKNSHEACRIAELLELI